MVPEPLRLETEAAYAQFEAAGKDDFAVTMPGTVTRTRSTRRLTWSTRPAT